MAQVSDFHYDLPHELIAQQPLAERSGSRMLVVDRTRGTFEDRRFENLPEYVTQGDCFLLNNTRVFPARLLGRRNRSDGAAVELFLLRSVDQHESVWMTLAKPAKRVRTGDCVLLSGTLSARVTSEGERGERTVEFIREPGSPDIRHQMDELGSVPLPPYIHRHADASDRERYQTVFAERRGSVAAPTAGLHFTPEILEHCRAAGADLAYLTLHVGLGTFAPLPEGDLSDAKLHSEFFEFSPAAATIAASAKRRICVGTTTVRTLETVLQRGGYGAATGQTNLFIQPGFGFRGTDAILTNFHLPESSLLMLVCAFAGSDLIMNAYRHAVEKRYRFFSYGDCMFIV